MSRKMWIQTRTGRAWDLLEPDPHNIDLRDIIFSLSQIVRFTGHAYQYSVAQHCILVSERVGELAPNDYKLQLGGLLHDAHEAYIGDWSAPLKVAIKYLSPEARKAINLLDYKHQHAIAEWAGLTFDHIHNEVVKQADLELLATERVCLMAPCKRKWPGEDDFKPLDTPIFPWNFSDVRALFWRRFFALREQAGLGDHFLQGAGYEP